MSHMYTEKVKTLLISSAVSLLEHDAIDLVPFTSLSFFHLSPARHMGKSDSRIPVSLQDKSSLWLPTRTRGYLPEVVHP